MPDRAAVHARILEFIAPLNTAAASVGEGTRFADDLMFDSLTVMDLVAGIEDEWNIVLPLNALPELETVGQLTDAVTRLANK